MKMKIFFSTVIGLILFSNSFAQQIQLDSIDSQVHQLIKDFDIPGLSIAVVRNDSVIFSKVMETWKFIKKEKLMKIQFFGIGSISKSFTAFWEY
jgi:CubicO group peptidase (beta-lactamase class C family)